MSRSDRLRSGNQAWSALSRHENTAALGLGAAGFGCIADSGTGKRDEARAMLAEIYGWFTKGFDTANLNAKALLDELRG